MYFEVGRLLFFMCFLDERIFNNNFLIIFAIRHVAHLFAIRTSPVRGNNRNILTYNRIKRVTL